MLRRADDFAHVPRGMTGRISRAIGLDLVAQQGTGLDRAVIRRMEGHCQACGQAEACANHIAAFRGRRADPLPNCPIRKMLLYLRDEA